MNEKNICLVGHDDGDGWIISVVVTCIIVAIIVAIVVYGGAFIGGFHSLKNYFLAFKHNVYDSNRKLPATT